ncbi:MAG: oxygenase MpaB family protein [Verrucomicrobiales bacterium]|nr:oxygenase MpaB family protein [Verrucomicrobiales bacterium]
MPKHCPSTFAFPLESEMWKINHRRCGLFFGSAAAILQIAHPRIAQGVADHSNFANDSLGRLNRTLAATNRIAFGTAEEAALVRKKIHSLHRGVKGKACPKMAGAPSYTAFEPDLLLWVLATLIMAALQGYEMVYGTVPAQRKEQFYREMREFGTFFGLEEGYGPADFEGFSEYYDSMIHGDLLGSHPLCAELAQAIVAPGDSRGAVILGKVIRFLPVETIPEPVRGRLGFQSTLSTRAAMKIVRTTSPFAFPCLPRKMQWFPEALERWERHHASEITRIPLSSGV